MSQIVKHYHKSYLHSEQQSGLNLDLSPATVQSSTRYHHQGNFANPRDVLPNEIFLHVLEYLDDVALLRTSRTSRSWRRICLEPRLWKRLYCEAQLYYDNDSENAWKTTAWDATAHGQPSITKGEHDWLFLYKQRKRIERNWRHNHSRMFYLPNRAHPWEGHTGRVNTIHQRGQWLISGSEDKTIRRWNLEKQRLIGLPLSGHSGEVRVLHYSMEEDLIISGCSQSMLILWRFSSGDLLQKIEHAHSEAISSVHLNSQFIITGSKDKSIKIWSRNRLGSGTGVFASISGITSILNGHVGYISSLVSYHGQIISASGDHSIKTWDPATSRCLKTFGDPNTIAHVHLSGRNTVAGGRSKRVNVLDHTTGNTVAFINSDNELLWTLQLIKTQSEPVRIISGSLSGAITVWEKATGLEWLPRYRIDVAEAVNNDNAKLRTAEASTLRKKTVEHTRLQPRRNHSRAQGYHILSELSENGVAKSRKMRTPKKSSVYSDMFSFDIHQNAKGYPSQVNFHGGNQELHVDEQRLHGNLVERSLYHSFTYIQQARVRNVQCNESWMTCSTGESTILGWDFANGDGDIETARRYVQEHSQFSLMR